MPQQLQPEARIAIVGAGPAGLSTAWYLKRKGFRNVTVFEELGRVGGLCRTITDGYRSFDLGGNYVTPAYRETLEIAKAVGARRMKAHEYLGARVEGDELRYYDIQQLVRQDPSYPDGKVPFWQLAWAVVRFGWYRWRLRSVIDGPTLEDVDRHADLCVSFRQWLADKRLLAMKGMFEIPITMMGYGFLDQIAAPYALKYMSPRTYLAMVLRGIPGLKTLSRWPQRFEQGFQRMWERVSWDLNVRLGVRIEEIERDPQRKRPIRIRFQHAEQVGNDPVLRDNELWFDRLVLACPLTTKVLEEFLSLTETEKGLFGKVETYSFCQTSLHCVDDETGEDFKLPKPVVCVFPFDRDTIGKPWAVVQYWGEASPMLQLYSRISLDGEGECDRDEILRAALRLLRRMGARPAGETDPEDARWVFYSRWPYFGHVSKADIKGGFFRQLEALQGENATYFVGGVTNFELIEPIVQYAKHLVETHFAAGGPDEATVHSDARG